MKYARMILFAIIMLIFSAIIASAQGVCVEREKVVSRLLNDYGETLFFQGVTKGHTNGTSVIIETFVNPETETFTIILTGNDGISCVTSVGEGFVQYEPLNPDKGL